MSPIALGTSLDEWEKEVRPPLIPDATYEFAIIKIEDQPVKATNRPQWKATLQIINHTDTDKQKVNGRSIDIYAQLPWINPQTDQIDRSNTFTLISLIQGTKTQLNLDGSIPDKEFFLGRTGVMRVGHKNMSKQNPDDPDEEVREVNTANIIYKKKGNVIA